MVTGNICTERSEEGSSWKGLSNWGAVTYPSVTAWARAVLAHSLLLWEGAEEAVGR